MTNVTPARRGPNLPYSIVAGVTPCVSGWLVASAKVQGTIFSPEDPRVIETFGEVLDQRPTFSVVAVNAPIGYPEKAILGGRACDRDARVLLGRRGSAVHSAPVRGSLEQGAVGTDDYLDAITMELLPRYREVASEMAPYRQRTVYEVHSELSFYQLNEDVPLQWSKKIEQGWEERRTLLEKTIPGVERILAAEIKDVPYSHLLDVAAFLWTARRIFAKSGLRVPIDPEWDDAGLRMEIVR
jgi:predicted RNase H-like nuclease